MAAALIFTGSIIAIFAWVVSIGGKQALRTGITNADTKAGAEAMRLFRDAVEAQRRPDSLAESCLTDMIVAQDRWRRMLAEREYNFQSLEHCWYTAIAIGVLFVAFAASHHLALGATLTGTTAVLFALVSLYFIRRAYPLVAILAEHGKPSEAKAALPNVPTQAPTQATVDGTLADVLGVARAAPELAAAVPTTPAKRESE